MSQLAIIRIDRGDFDEGFSALVRIEEGDRCIYDKIHSLPPAPKLPELYQNWKSRYSARPLRADRNGEETPSGEKSNFRVLEIVEGQTTNVSIADLANELETGLNKWLNSLDRGLQELREGLLDNLNKSENILFIIETAEETLCRLPWDRWDFFDRYDKGDVLLSFPNRSAPRPQIKLKEKVKILVILGESSDIDVQADLHLLRDKLPDAEILEPLIATNRETVNRALWDEKFDILFFAGHSSTDFRDGRGKFYINETESLSIADLKDALKKAIANGLKLAIFNSCDGIGLGRDLTDLQMPAIVVMREKIPDEAAQKFLEFFLQAFAMEGKLLSAAVTEARKKLKGLEGRYPCASWLPVLCQHPEAEMLTWESLREVKRKQLPKLPGLQSLPKVVCGSFLVAAATMGIRWMQLLEPVELVAYDILMAQRPAEPIDPRIVVLEITPYELDKYHNPLPDAQLAEGIAIVQAAKPAAIGLALHRDQTRGEGRQELIEQFEENNVYTVCAFGSGDLKGYPPPPQLTKEQVNNQVAFSNFLLDDRFDGHPGAVRRHFLSYDSSSDPSECPSDNSLSFLLAFRYLSSKGIILRRNQNREWHHDETVFERLGTRHGGYQDSFDTNQILLNYRANPEPAIKVSLTEVLEGRVEPNWFEDKIVIIGVKDGRRGKEDFDTPYGPMPAIWVHAHQTSQIISKVLDQRPSIWVLPEWKDLQWGDALFVWVWALTGGLVAWRLRSPWQLALGGGVAILVLYQTSLAILTLGGWMPLVPSAIALLLTGGGVVLNEKTK